jgi:hypothetical protein
MPLDGREIDRRLRLGGALDAGFAALYLALGLGAARGRSLAFDLALGAVCALLIASGAAQLARARMARRLAIAAAGLLLAFTATVVALLVASWAYLRGVWGPLGEGAAWVSLISAALVIELCGIWPLFQLRFFRRAEVVRHFTDGK